MIALDPATSSFYEDERYNLRTEEELGTVAVYAGRKAFVH